MERQVELQMKEVDKNEPNVASRSVQDVVC